MAGNVVHETSHYYDLKDNVNTNEVCGFGLDENFNIGWNSNNYTIQNYEDVQRIKQTTEIKAYILSTLVWVVGWFIILRI